MIFLIMVPIIACSYLTNIVDFILKLVYIRNMQQLFKPYLSPVMIEKLQTLDNVVLTGENKELSIFCVAIHNFNSISMHYGTNAQELTSVLSRYMTVVTDSILDNHGTLNATIDTTRTAFWNAPLDDTEHALHAVQTAIVTLDRLKELNNNLSKNGEPSCNIGFGVSTSKSIVGNMGGTQRFAYTCLGSGTTLAIELEKQSAVYQVNLILSSLTAKYAATAFDIVELDTVLINGISSPTRIFTVVGKKNAGGPKYITAHEQHDKFLACYRARRFDVAIALAKALSSGWDGQLKDYYTIMSVRCEELRGQPPTPHWDDMYQTTRM